MKRCTKCGEYKPLSEYSKNKNFNDGFSYTCKPCSKKAKQQWYKDNKQRVYAQSRQWKKDNHEKSKESANKTARKPKYKARTALCVKRYKKTHHERIKANAAVARAVKSGMIIKPECCEVCYAIILKSKLVGHHEDYDCPLLVVWLCCDCHSNYHLGKSNKADNIRKKVKEIYRGRVETILFSKSGCGKCEWVKEKCDLTGVTIIDITVMTPDILKELAFYECVELANNSLPILVKDNERIVGAIEIKEILGVKNG